MVCDGFALFSMTCYGVAWYGVIQCGLYVIVWCHTVRIAWYGISNRMLQSGIVCYGRSA